MDSWNNYVPVVALLLVLVFTAVRKVGTIRLAIWQIMAVGAVLVLLAGSIGPAAAFESIHWDVMAFLFGMFVVGEALEESGLLEAWSVRVFARCRTRFGVMAWVLTGSAGLSAVLMNDTLAIIGTPIVLRMARHNRMAAGPLLLALAFGVTIGSVMSPIGNPQNLLIAVGSGLTNPFVVFFQYLLVPTVINVIVAIFLLWLFERRLLSGPVAGIEGSHSVCNSDPGNCAKPEPGFVTTVHLPRPARPGGRDRLVWASRLALGLVLVLILTKLMLVLLAVDWALPLHFIALAGALPVLFLAPSRVGLLRRIDWATLVFFAAMFILMQSVWNTGLLQPFFARFDINSIPVILVLSVVVSQLLSNVPAVALLMPMMISTQVTTSSYMALAAGSTLAGNLFILGAASNVIIIIHAEKEGETVGFWQFSRVGLLLTACNLVVMWAWLRAVP